VDNAEGIQHYTRAIFMPAFNPVPRNACIYTPAELEANQAGRLTAAQAEWLRAHVELRRHQLRSDWIKFIPITLILTGGSVWIGFGPIGFCMSVMLLILYFLPAWMRLQRGWSQHILADADEGRVFTATGVVTLSTRKLPEDQPEVQHWLHLGNLNLLIDSLTYERIDPDETYTVFYAPRSKIAVLVQPREGSYVWDEVGEPAGPTPEDREHNELNRLSPDQITRLRQLFIMSIVRLILIILLVIVSAGFGLLFMMQKPSEQLGFFDWFMAGVLMLTALLLIFNNYGMSVNWFARLVLAIRHDLRTGIVSKAEDLLTFDPQIGPNNLPQIRVGNELLEIEWPMVDMLQEGEPYRIFFTPRSRVVILIEGLGASSNPQDESQSS
jgi:hypothetical protein